MNWKLSRYRKGDFVKIRSKEEILASLDELGRLDGMPFMPEMLKYCGQRFHVSAVAHKTCDTARQTWKGRRLNSTVHLAGLRCDGSAHGGCEAECNLFWKDDWLRPVAGTDTGLLRPTTARNDSASSCSERQLLGNTSLGSNAEREVSRYFCQATEMYDATQHLHWWDVRQYAFDVLTKNHSVKRVLRVLFLASLRWIFARIPFGYRAFKKFHDWAHFRLTGRASPSLNGHIPDGEQTPVGKLNLVPGEFVRIRTQKEIERTLNRYGKNRGLIFDPQEMAPYCGRVVKVKKAVNKIIEEPTGKMLYMKQPCIMLCGVFCNAEYANCRLNCPREISSYWREIWLERIEANHPSSEKGECPNGAQTAQRSDSSN